MATAVGTYATLDALKADMNETGSTKDTLLRFACDRANAFIERKTGRILAPYAGVARTVVSGSGAIWTLTSGTGVTIGDALMFGPVSGTHEHGTVAGVAGNVVTLQAPLAAAYAASVPVVRVQLFDGTEALENARMLPVPNGIVTATSLEVAFYTGGAYNLIPATDWFLRPTPLSREPGWPATELWMTDVPTSGNPCPIFPSGMGNIRLVCQPGWPAIPDDITDLALRIAAGIFRIRAAAPSNQGELGPDGERRVERLLTADDWHTLNSYKYEAVSIV